MPASGTVTIPMLTEPPCTQPEVTINGSFYDYCTCMSIEDGSGVVPGKALIRIGGNGYDVQGNITLNAYNFPDMVPGARVVVTDGSIETYHLGTLRKRLDTGEGNTIVWESWDDRYYLSQIFMRGCLVYDQPQNKVLYISGYPCRVNPKGYRNCIIMTVPGIDFPVPVFAYTSEARAGYDNSDTDLKDTVGVICNWTPIRFLKYCCALANIKAGSVDGTGVASDASGTPKPPSGKSDQAADNHWRSLATATRLQWLPKANELLTTSLGDNKEMYRKMPDETFQGQGMLKVVNGVLDATGDFGFGVGIVTNTGGKQISSVQFFSRDMSYADNGSGKTLTIPLLRGGDAEDYRTAVDFHLDEDSSTVALAALGEGARRRVEMEMRNNGDGTKQTNTDGAFKQIWDADDFKEFHSIINGYDASGGASPPADLQFAKYPTQYPDKTKNQTWASMLHVDADGLNGHSLASHNSPEALKLARQVLPHVMRTFGVDSDYLQRNPPLPLQGHNLKFKDSKKYPVLYSPRPVLPEQLSYFLLADLNGSLQWTRNHFPVRVQVDGHGAGGSTDGPHDCEFNNGFRPNSDGTFSLDALTDDLGNAADLIYTGSIVSAPHKIALKEIIINIAVPLDHRVASYAVAQSQSATQLDPQDMKELGGPPMLYMDSPDGFKEHHRVNSNPSVANALPVSGAPDSTSAPPTGPANDVLEDDSDTSISKNLYNTVNRKLKMRSYSKRTSSWILVGIRSEYKVGQFVSRCVVKGQTGDGDYIVNAPIERITYDFLDQVTRIGDLISTTGERGRSKNSKALSNHGGQQVQNQAGGRGKGSIGFNVFGGQAAASGGGSIAGSSMIGIDQNMAKGRGYIQGGMTLGAGQRQETGNPMYAGAAALIGASSKMNPGDWVEASNHL